VVQHRIVKHLENARAEGRRVISSTTEDLLASLERVVTVHYVELRKAVLVPGGGNEGSQLMGHGTVNADDLDATLKR